MAKKKGIPLDKMFDFVRAVQAADAHAGEHLKVELLVGDGAPRAQVQTLKRCFMPETAQAHVLVWDLASRTQTAPDMDCGLIVVLAGDQESAAATVAARAASRGVRCIVVVSSALDAPEVEGPAADYVSILAAADAEALEAKLGAAIAHHPQRVLAGACFPAFRSAIADELIQEAALANLGVGAVPLIPGSDLPIMLAAQERLALDLLSLYGKEIGPETFGDLGAVLGAGLFYRAAARGLAGALPGLGFALKGAIGFGGTVLSGRAVEMHAKGEMSLPDLSALIPKKPAARTEPEPKIVPISALPEYADAASEGYIELG